MQKNENDPIPPILEQLSSLLQFVEDNAKTSLDSPLDPTIRQRLEIVEDLVEKFKEVTLEGLRKKGIDTVDVVMQVVEHPDQLKPSNKEILRRSSLLSLDAVMLRRALQSAQTIGVQHKEFSKELADKKVSKKTIKDRQKKFKKMGGNSTWMPL